MSEALYSACRFCGQIRTFEADSDLTPEAMEEIATCGCKCSEAVNYNKRMMKIQNAKDVLNDILGESSIGYGRLEVVPEVHAEILALVILLIDDKISSASVSVADNNVKIKISKNAKGNVSINRADAAALKMEV